MILEPRAPFPLLFVVCICLFCMLFGTAVHRRCHCHNYIIYLQFSHKPQPELEPSLSRA